MFWVCILAANQPEHSLLGGYFPTGLTCVRFSTQATGISRKVYAGNLSGPGSSELLNGVACRGVKEVTVLDIDCNLYMMIVRFPLPQGVGVK